MNALVDSYHAQNAEDGHDYGCPWGAGADCGCSVRTRSIERSVAACRVEYRGLKAASGLTWADFTSSCTVLVDAEVAAGRVATYEGDEVAWAFVDAGKIVAEWGVKIVDVPTVAA